VKARSQHQTTRLAGPTFVIGLPRRPWPRRTRLSHVIQEFSPPHALKCGKQPKGSIVLTLLFRRAHGLVTGDSSVPFRHLSEVQATDCSYTMPFEMNTSGSSPFCLPDVSRTNEVLVTIFPAVPTGRLPSNRDTIIT